MGILLFVESFVLRIVLKCLHAQRNLAVLCVEVNNLCGDDITDVQYVRRLVHMISGDLRYMKQRVDTGLKLYKSAEVSHAGNAAFHDCAYSVLLISGKPRILIVKLQAECNAVSFDILDQAGNLLSNGKDGTRIVYTAPAHLGDVKQSVCSAEIDECTEICDVLYGSLNDIADMDSGEELLLSFLLLGLNSMITNSIS